jgi:hypothetical protein
VTQRDPKKSKYNFEELKAGATSPDVETRAAAFRDYFERFEEYPSFLFDNERQLDPRLAETVQYMQSHGETSEKMLQGLKLMLDRLPSSD